MSISTLFGYNKYASKICNLNKSTLNQSKNQTVVFEICEIQTYHIDKNRKKNRYYLLSFIQIRKYLYKVKV